MFFFFLALIIYMFWGTKSLKKVGKLVLYSLRPQTGVVPANPLSLINPPNHKYCPLLSFSVQLKSGTDQDLSHRLFFTSRTVTYPKPYVIEDLIQNLIKERMPSSNFFSLTLLLESQSHLYNRVCPPVRPSDCLSVRPPHIHQKKRKSTFLIKIWTEEEYQALQMHLCISIRQSNGPSVCQ